MKRKSVRLDAEVLVRSVESVRDSVTGRKKLALRTAAVTRRLLQIARRNPEVLDAA